MVHEKLQAERARDEWTISHRPHCSMRPGRPAPDPCRRSFPLTKATQAELRVHKGNAAAGGRCLGRFSDAGKKQASGDSAESNTPA